MTNQINHNSFKNNKHQIFLALVIGVLFVLMIPFQLAYSVGFFFNDIINLSNTPDNFSASVQLAVSGADVHVVWLDENFFTYDIFYAKSTDGGITFGTPVNLSDNPGLSENPQISVSGSNVFVVWTDDTDGFGNELFFSRSTDGGTTFNDSLDPFDPGIPVNLSNNLVGDASPQLALSGGNLIITWIEDSGTVGEIFYILSSDDGASFGTPVNLSNTPLGFSRSPRMATSGTNVAVVWNDDEIGNEEIYFSQSTDNGLTFNGSLDPSIPGPPINLSNNSGLSQIPKIAMSGSNLFVVWQDFTPGNDDIFYSRSTDGGVTFNGGSPGIPINLSDNFDLSGAPDIEASGTNVYVTWHDLTPGNLEIFFMSSNDSGATFDAVKNLSSNSDFSVDPRIAASGTNVYLVWQDFTPLNLEIFFKASDDNGENFSGIVNLSNDAFDSGFNVELEMLGNAAFVVWPNDGPFGFDIMYRKGSQSSIDIVYDASQYKLTDTAGLNITAPDFNLDIGLAETISVTVTSTTDPIGIEIFLTETDLDTGIFTGSHTFTTNPSSTPDLQADIGDTITSTFGGQTGTASIFPRVVLFDNEAYILSSLSTITVSDQNANADTLTAETVVVTVTSTSDPIGISIILTETDVDTGIFVGTHTFTTNPSSGSALNTAEGDTVTASYFSAIDTASITPGFTPGGSGGGLVIRPGLVLDLLGFSLYGKDVEIDPSKPIEPSNDPTIDFPLKIDEDGFVLPTYSSTIATRTKTVGEPIKLQLFVNHVYEIQHVGFYTNLREPDREIEDSDTYIIYDKSNPLQIIDPNNILSSVKINSTKDGSKNTFVFEFVFAKPMEKSDIIIRVWDSIRSTSDTKILDAWEVKEIANKNIQNNIPAQGIVSQDDKQENAKASFTLLIEKWTSLTSEPISDTEFLSGFGIQGERIPSWFKTNAGWVLKGNISEQELIDAVNYLNKIGIIK